jgi:hypothetical protein
MPAFLMRLTTRIDTGRRIAHELLVSPRGRNAVWKRATTVNEVHAEA